MMRHMRVPDSSWYDRPSTDVARDLLGAVLVRRTAEGTVALRLTEVEAYDGEHDPGSHAYRGRSARNATMFDEGGRLYVYRHLGLHHCVNVVCGPSGRASAVLVRAGEVLDGEVPDDGALDGAVQDGGVRAADGAVAGAPPGGRALAARRRRAAGVLRSDRDLARGPARLTVALALDLADDGADVTDPAGDVVLALPGERQDASPGVVRSGPRVGVSGDGGRGDLFPWRFWLDGEETVSDYRPAGRRAPRATAGRRAARDGGAGAGRAWEGTSGGL